MVIYIHGFGGSGEGVKASKFREYFKLKNKRFIAPSLSYNPTLAINTLKEIINSFDEDIFLIGSSLGGYYATYLEDFAKKIVLINPATKPYETLKRALGFAKNYFDNSKFEWNENHLNLLKKYKKEPKKLEKYMLLLQKGDEILDYKDAVKKYNGANIVLEDGGSHSFDGIERYFEKVEKFFL